MTLPQADQRTDARYPHVGYFFCPTCDALLGELVDVNGWVWIREYAHWHGVLVPGSVKQSMKGACQQCSRMVQFKSYKREPTA